MNTESEDYKRNLEDYTTEKAEFESKRLENNQRLDSLQKKVEEIEHTKLNSDLECYNLDTSLKETISKHNALETVLNSRIKELEPQHENIFNLYADNKSQLDYMKQHTIQMNERMVELAKSKEFMQKTIEKTNAEIDELKWDWFVI